MTFINNFHQDKVKGSQNEDDKKKVLFDKKAKNVLQSILDMVELFRISYCKKKSIYFRSDT